MKTPVGCEGVGYPTVGYPKFMVINAHTCKLLITLCKYVFDLFQPVLNCFKQF